MSVTRQGKGVPQSPIDLAELAAEGIQAAPHLNQSEATIAISLYRLLAQGEPVSPEQLAKRTGSTADDIESTLGGWPGVYRDDEERVIGFWGLAVGEFPPHRFEVDGLQLSVWCAWDSLFIPQILGKTAQVESVAPKTGDPISLVVGPEGVESASPKSAVLSFLRPKEGFTADVIQNFCHYIFFFSSEEAARRWTSEHDETFLLSIDEGFELGRLWVQGVFGAALEKK